MNIFVSKMGAGTWYAQLGGHLVVLKGKNDWSVRNSANVNVVYVSDAQLALIAKSLPIIK